MIRKLYPRLHLTEAEFMALPECGLYGPVGQRVGTRWKSRFTDGWFIGVWETAGGWSYEASRTWYQPVIRCARAPALPSCEHCREPVSDDDLHTHAWEAQGTIQHKRCAGPRVVVRYGGFIGGKAHHAETERLLMEMEQRGRRYG